MAPFTQSVKAKIPSSLSHLYPIYHCTCLLPRCVHRCASLFILSAPHSLVWTPRLSPGLRRRPASPHPLLPSLHSVLSLKPDTSSSVAPEIGVVTLSVPGLSCACLSPVFVFFSSRRPLYFQVQMYQFSLISSKKVSLLSLQGLHIGCPHSRKESCRFVILPSSLQTSVPKPLLWEGFPDPPVWARPPPVRAQRSLYSSVMYHVVVHDYTCN